MSRGTDFLKYITEQIQEGIQELGARIQEIQKDIAGMNDY